MIDFVPNVAVMDGALPIGRGSAAMLSLDRLRRIFWAGTAFALALLGTAPAVATALLSPQIDFRDSLFSAANNQHSFSTVVDGIGFTITAEVAGAPGGGTATLWWDSKDGLGIRHNYENDEIEGTERLRLSFDNTIGLSEIFVSDLFVEGDYSEIGYYQIDNGVTFAFDAQSLMGTDGNKANGEHLITIDPVIPVNDLLFFAPGNIGGRNHEFALLGFTDPPLNIVIVEPATLTLFGVGIAGLAGIRIRRRQRRVA